MGERAIGGTKIAHDDFRAIRHYLHYSQTEIMKLVTPHTAANLRATISQWEAGTKHPTLTAVLKYARLANIPCELLLDDRLDLPDRFHTLEPLPANRRVRRTGTVAGQTILLSSTDHWRDSLKTN